VIGQAGRRSSQLPSWHLEFEGAVSCFVKAARGVQGQCQSASSTFTVTEKLDL